MYSRIEGRGLPVLIIHGWSLLGDVEAADFEPIFQSEHTSGYSRIYVDLPGMGQSPPDGIKSLDDILERLSQFVRTELLPRKFLIIGTSCGAYLARALAFRFTDQVQGLLLRVPLIESGPRDIDPFKALIKNPELINTLPAEERQMLGNVEIQTSEYVQRLKTQLTDLVVPAVAASDEKLLASIRDDPSTYTIHEPKHTRAEPFEKPTLILTGRADTVVGYRDAWKILDCYPRATFAALDRGRHGGPVDDVALFQALVHDWLYRVQEFIANER